MTHGITARHKIIMMTQNRPKFFLPVSSCTCSDTVSFVSDKAGYVRMTGDMLRGGEQLLTVIYKCWFGIVEACGKYIFPEDYELTAERLFIREGTGDVRCEFAPKSAEEKCVYEAFEKSPLDSCANAMCTLTDELYALSCVVGARVSLSREDEPYAHKFGLDRKLGVHNDTIAEDAKKIFCTYSGDVKRTGRELAKLRRSVWMIGNGGLSRGLDL